MISRHEPAGSAAFTAVELILVVLILSLLAGLAVPHLSRTHKSFELKKQAQDLAYVMRYAQSRSVTKGRQMRLEFSPDFSSYRLTEETEGGPSGGAEGSLEAIAGRWGRGVPVPAAVTVRSDEMLIRFYADGSIDKRHVSVCQEERCWTVSTKEKRGHVQIWENDRR